MSSFQLTLKLTLRKGRLFGVDYDTMMHRLERDDYINMGENESYKALDYDDFAKHVEIVTGRKEAYPPFTCSC